MLSVYSNISLKIHNDPVIASAGKQNLDQQSGIEFSLTAKEASTASAFSFEYKYQYKYKYKFKHNHKVSTIRGLTLTQSHSP